MVTSQAAAGVLDESPTHVPFEAFCGWCARWHSRATAGPTPSQAGDALKALSEQQPASSGEDDWLAGLSSGKEDDSGKVGAEGPVGPPRLEHAVGMRSSRGEDHSSKASGSVIDSLLNSSSGSSGGSSSSSAASSLAAAVTPPPRQTPTAAAEEGEEGEGRAVSVRAALAIGAKLVGGAATVEQVGDLTTWTVLQQRGPNRLGLC